MAMQQTPKRRALFAVPLVLLGATMPLFVEQSTLASIRGASRTELVPRLQPTNESTFQILPNVTEEEPTRVNSNEEEFVIRTNKNGADGLVVASNKDTVVVDEDERVIMQSQSPERITTDADQTTTTILQTPMDESSNSTRPAVHVLYGLSGNNRNFLAEFEVSLKSVLLNAPLNLDLEIHVLCDDAAFKSIPKILSKAKLQSSKWATRITIHTYNVSPFVSKWKKRIAQVYQSKIGHVTRHTIGAYFRLFANDVLAKDIHHVVYLDTDVVIMSNLGDLWQRFDRNATFVWGSHCSGFIVLNVPKLPLFWSMASEYDFRKYSSGDQLIMKKVGQIHPEEVASLPKEWSLSVGNGGLWRHAKHIVEYRPKVGMFHFNGQGARKTSWFQNKNGFPYKHSSTFGNALYYVNMPWTWARFQGESLAAGGDKYKLVVQYHNKSSKTSSNSTKAEVVTDEGNDVVENITSSKVDAVAAVS